MTTLTIRISQRSNGLDVAEATYGGLSFRAVSRNGATMALARQIVAAGATDGPWQAVGAEGRVRVFGLSLHGLAKLTIKEPDRGRMHVARFTPFAGVSGGTVSGADGQTAATFCFQRPEAIRPLCGDSRMKRTN